MAVKATSDWHLPCHLSDGEIGLGFQSPWAGSLDPSSDKEQCGVSWGRDGGQPAERGFCAVPGASGSSGSCLWGLRLAFFYPARRPFGKEE